ncbi:MAG: DUF4407 domain-containing protein [Treponema sp.]|nr:DUF4407 domain-containing protein [Treponema sp.]
MGNAQTQLTYPRGLDFEQVWAALMENREQQKEIAQIVKEITKETDRQIKEITKETARLHRETAQLQSETSQLQRENAQQQKETDQQIKDYNRRFGDLTKRFGEVVEHMIAPGLQDKFKEFGFNFLQSSDGFSIKDHDNDIFFEIDVLLQNGEKAMMVEIKTKLTAEDVKDHIERLIKMRAYADLHGDKRTFLGAVAGVVVSDDVKKYVLKQGLFLIEPSGETFNITAPDNKPKEW